MIAEYINLSNKSKWAPHQDSVIDLRIRRYIRNCDWKFVQATSKTRKWQQGDNLVKNVPKHCDPFCV